ncbi:TIGR02281 family clan AA aspartic protease [Massilia sp. BJB1822]|uniref:TIGR02281 family clan AA aspartic protease n=1 Tax=Massilia sp. BJB1822 TaxID=2744470 RepID=UPI001E3490D1|nr:TIGR02281 family clan AA aspartic protease [Massilia sp. BJB1822]
MRLRVFLSCLLGATAAQAGDVSLMGVFAEKAMLAVDGAPPKVYAVGAVLPDGSKLVAVAGNQAVIEENGRRYSIVLGANAARGAAGAQARITLAPDAMGHYLVNGEINGQAARMLIDTGASLVALPAAEARRMGIDYRKGKPMLSSTAGGVVPVYRVRLDKLRIGEIELNGLEAVVHESGLPVILLGNSFLNRFEMRRDGEQMTLQRRN